MKVEDDVFYYDGEQRPVRPSPKHEWRGGKWVVNLDQVKADALTAISTSFNAQIGGGFGTSLNIRMDAAIEALQKLKTGYDFAKLVGATTMSVVDYDNAVHVDLSLSDIEKIMREVGGNYQSLYMLKQQLRGQVMAATTPGQVAEVAWP